MALFRHFAQKTAGSQVEGPIDDVGTDGAQISVPANMMLLITSATLVSEHGSGPARIRIREGGLAGKIAALFSLGPESFSTFLECGGSGGWWWGSLALNSSRQQPNAVAVLDGGTGGAKSFTLSLEQPVGAAFGSVTLVGATYYR